MNLKDLAVPASPVDGLTLWWMPYPTLKSQALLSEFGKLVPMERWGTGENMFILAEGLLVAAAADETAAAYARGIAAYVAERTSDLSVNYALFQSVASNRAITTLLDAYNETRDHSYAGDLTLVLTGDAPDPEAQGGEATPLPSSEPSSNAP